MNRKKAESQVTFDAQASSVDTTFYGRHARRMIPELIKQIEDFCPASLLDLGCGTGVMLKQLSSILPQSRLWGLDLSEAMLAQARKQCPTTVQLIQGDSEFLPFEENQFDLVVCNDSFHHYPAPAAVLLEIKRCLKPGGILLIGDCTLPFPLRSIMNMGLRYNHEGDVRIYSRKEMTSLLSSQFIDIRWQALTCQHLIVSAGVEK